MHNQTCLKVMFAGLLTNQMFQLLILQTFQHLWLHDRAGLADMPDRGQV